MSQTARTLNQQQLKSLCGVVAHTSEGLTKSELTTLLGQCGMCAVDDGSFRNQFWIYHRLKQKRLALQLSGSRDKQEQIV